MCWELYFHSHGLIFKNFHVLKLCFLIFQGPPIGLHALEVRDTSVVVLWEPPLFNGRSPVNGYYLDIKEASAGEEGWKAVHEKTNKAKFMKVNKINMVRGDNKTYFF